MVKSQIYSEFQTLKGYHLFVEGGLPVCFLFGINKVHFCLQGWYSIHHSDSKARKCFKPYSVIPTIKMIIYLCNDAHVEYLF